MKLELAIIAILLLPSSIESGMKHARVLLNWLERRKHA